VVSSLSFSFKDWTRGLSLGMVISSHIVVGHLIMSHFISGFLVRRLDPWLTISNEHCIILSNSIMRHLIKSLFIIISHLVVSHLTISHFITGVLLRRLDPWREVGGWGRDPFSRNFMKPTPRRKWYLTTGRRFH